MAFQFAVRGISASSTEALNLFVLDSTPDSTIVQNAMSAFYNEYADHCNGSVSFTLEPEYREFTPATGQTTFVAGYSSVTPWTQVGTSSPTSMPDQTALLVRWKTGTWVNGRQVTGRTYLPYPSQSTGGGAPSNTVVNDITAQANTLIAAIDLCIWSRTAGAVYPITSASVWTEYAVQRRRRD